MRILLVEDDPQLGSTLQRAIDHEGYLAEWVTTAEQAYTALASGDFDMMVLDWMLPQQSGVDLLKQLRRKQYTFPVLMLTACVGADKKVLGLDSGADDYLTKPFNMDELMARLRALSRRRVVRPDMELRTSELVLNPDKSELNSDSVCYSLSRNELIIMRALIENSGRYIPKSKLEELISHWDQPVTDNAIEVQISRLRKRLGKEIIQTLRGVGYKVKA